MWQTLCLVALDNEDVVSSDGGNVSSPRPPTFCTPGLKVQKKDMSCVADKTVEEEEVKVAKSLDTPPIPSFETRWIKPDTLVSDFYW